jgi:hypothetical protein
MLICYNRYFGLKVRREIRFPVQAQSPFHFSVPFDPPNVLSSAGEMQNFGEGSVNLEVSRIRGLDGRFLQGWKLDINLIRSITQTRTGSCHTYSVLVGYVRILKCFALSLE